MKFIPKQESPEEKRNRYVHQFVYEKLERIPARVRGKFADTFVELYKTSAEAGFNAEELIEERILELDRSLKQLQKNEAAGEASPASAVGNVQLATKRQLESTLKGWEFDLDREIKKFERIVADSADRLLMSSKQDDRKDDDPEVFRRDQEQKGKKERRMMSHLANRTHHSQPKVIGKL